jgi:hypothetical protein
MTNLEVNSPWGPFLMFLLLSLLFNPVNVHAMFFPSGAEGLQHTGLGTASTVCQICERVVQICVCHAATSPALWQRLLNSGDPAYLPADSVLPHHAGAGEQTPKFERELDMDDTEDDTSLLGQDTTSDRQGEPSYTDLDAVVMEEPSESQIILEDYQRQQEEAQFLSIPSNSWDLSSAPSPSSEADGVMSPPFGGISPTVSHLDVGVESNVSEQDSRTATITRSNSLTITEGNSNAVTPIFLNGPYNFGDRFNSQHGLDHVKTIVSTAFESEISPPEPVSYPPRIPQADIPPSEPEPVPASAPFSAEQLSGLMSTLSMPVPTSSSRKHMYRYECPIHGLVFDKKELTLLVSPAPCLHPY